MLPARARTALQASPAPRANANVAAVEWPESLYGSGSSPGDLSDAYLQNAAPERGKPRPHAENELRRAVDALRVLV